MPKMPKLRTLVEVRKLVFFVILIFDIILVIKVYILRGITNKNETLREEL